MHCVVKIPSFFCSLVWILLEFQIPSSDTAVFPMDDDMSISRSQRQVVDVETDFDGDTLIPLKYNINSPPPTNGTPTDVQVAILIVNVRDIKDLSEELTLEMNLKLGWKDARLNHLGKMAKDRNQSFIVLHPDTVNKLWHPDLYIDHAKTITQPSIISKPASLRVYADGTLRYSARLTYAQSCQMDFLYYPADTQNCNVELMSYAYSNAKLNLTWKGSGATLANKLVLPNVHVGMDNPDTFVVTTSSGKYAGLRFTILLRRKLSYHLLQTYLPSSLFVVISWQSFFIPLDSVPGRMALCMTTLLTLTSMFSSVRQNIPVVSYIKAIDVWMVSMIFFVFLTLLEFTLVLKIKSKQAKAAYKGDKEKLNEIPLNEIKASQTSSSPNPIDLNESSTSHLSLSSGQDESILGATSQTPPLIRIKDPSAPEKSTRRNWNIFETAWENLCTWSPDTIEHKTPRAIVTLFFVFQFLYWPILLYKAHYYELFTNTVYYSA